MNRIKKVFVVVHIVLWCMLTFFVALQLHEDNDRWLTATAGVIGTCLYVFYSHFYLLTRFSGRKKNGSYFLKIAGIILTGPFPHLLFNFKKLEDWEVAFEYYMMILVSLVIIFFFLGWLARVTENLVINAFKKEQLEKQAVEAELYYLKSQINPHFLFNTLNNIHTLVYKQAPTAPEAVLQLASLMRYMSYESNAATVPLKRELEYLQDYMSLQQLRYKHNPVDFFIKGETDHRFIAPLLFIHLLENAYKHSPARLNPGDIKVNVEVKDSVLNFSIQNPVSKKEMSTVDEQGGIGLSNVRKRLSLLYPEQHILEIHDTGEQFTVILKIDGLQLFPDERKTQLLYH